MMTSSAKLVNIADSDVEFTEKAAVLSCIDGAVDKTQVAAVLCTFGRV